MRNATKLINDIGISIINSCKKLLLTKKLLETSSPTTKIETIKGLANQDAQQPFLVKESSFELITWSQGKFSHRDMNMEMNGNPTNNLLLPLSYHFWLGGRSNACLLV